MISGKRYDAHQLLTEIDGWFPRALTALIYKERKPCWRG
jgi:hypothetical protein